MVVVPVSAVPATARDVSVPVRDVLVEAGEGAYTIGPDGVVQRRDPWSTAPCAGMGV